MLAPLAQTIMLVLSIDPVSWPLLSDTALEVMCISLAMSIISFGLPSLWSTCTPKPTDTTNLSDQEKVSPPHSSRRGYARVADTIVTSLILRHLAGPTRTSDVETCV